MSGICADLGRCAYDVADEMMGDEPSQGCPWWSECFGVALDGTEETPCHE